MSRLIELLESLLRRLGLLRSAAPNDLQTFTEDAMNLRLSWTFKQPTSKQRPIAGVLIEGRVAPSLPFQPIEFVPVLLTTVDVTDLDPGQWEFQGKVRDVDGQYSSPKSVAFAVPFDPPSELATITAVAV